MANLFIAYWDTLGFETVIDLTEHDRLAMWAELKGEQPKRLHVVPLLIMRAKANPQRTPEIWTFQSEVDLETLLQYSKDSPQQLAALIREDGSKVFVTPREKEQIR